MKVERVLQLIKTKQTWALQQKATASLVKRGTRPAVLNAGCPATDSKAGNQIFKNNTSSHNAPLLRFSLQHYLIPQSTAATRLICGQGLDRRHALQPMGEPPHDIMVIFREVAAADKVSLHAVELRVYTQAGRQRTAVDSATA